MPALSDADESLQQLLLDHQVLELRQLNQALAAREQGWQRALRRFVGVYCSISEGHLLLQDYVQGRELGSLTLDGGFDPDMQRPTVFYLSPDQSLDRATLLPEETGLLLTNEACWVQTRDPLDMPMLGLSSRLQILPGHDLAISPRRDCVAVSEREAGRLQLVSLGKPQLLANLDVREPGSHKAINLCFTPAGPHKGRLWISDSESDRLGWIDPGSRELKWLETGLGRLGQLTISTDGSRLYVLALSPLLRLVYIDPVSFELRGELDLPGSPLSLSPGVPLDVLEWHDDQLLLITQSHGSSPQLLRVSPELTLGEVSNLPPVAGWPALIVGQVNPIQKWATRRLDDWIAELEMLTAEHLARLRQEAQFAGLMKLRTTDYEVPQAFEDPADTLCRQAPPIILPPEAIDVIVDMLVQAYFQEHGQNLRSQPKEISRLRETAAELKQEIEKRYVALAQVDAVMGKHSLQLVLTRDLLLRSLDYHLGSKQLPYRPGHCCPICALGLKNPRFCPHCGFQLDDPEWTERRRNQSAEACDELIPGQVVLALPQVRQLVFMDAWLQVISEITGRKGGTEDNPVQDPVHVLALPEGSWLVCDREAGVYELSPTGELQGQLDHRFGEPVLATFRRKDGELNDLLVLDAAGEIFVFSRDGRMQQSWGQAEGLRLKEPTDLQATWGQTFLITEPDSPRVIEWNPGNESTVNSWGPEQKLERPVLARRQLNGETLIVDAGRGELLFFSADEPERLVRSFRYWPPTDFEQLVSGQPAPDRMLVMPQGDLICLGRKYWLQMQLTLGKIRWVQPWTGRRRPLQQKKKLQDLISEDESLKRLRKIFLLRPLSTAALNAVATELDPVNPQPGEWVLKANDMNGILFFLLEGEVEIRRPDDPAPLAVLTAGETFGEVPLILSEPFGAGFKAREGVRLMQLKRSNFKKAIAKASELAPMLRELAHQRKHLLTQATSSQTEGMVEKVKAQLAIKRLQDIKLFAHSEPAFLEEVAEAVRPLAFMPAKVVFSQEDLAEKLYFISRGKVGYYLGNSRQAFLELGPGDVFGELAMLNQQVHPAMAKTESYCQLYELDLQGYTRLLLQRPELKDELRTIAMERIPDLEAERDRLSYEPTAAENRPMADIISLSRLRPAQAFIASDHHEKAFCVDENGQILWSSEGSKARLYRPTRLSTTDDLLWVADSGHDRLVALSKGDGRYVRQLGSPKIELSSPRSVVQTMHQHLLIADSGNQRLVMVSPSGELLWEYGAPHEIMNPWYTEQTLKGTVLFADRDLHMIFEVDPRSKEIVWTYGSMMNAGNAPGELSEPSCVRRMSNGATLIVDTGNDRLLLLSPVGTLMRSFEGSEEIPLTRPIHAELMTSGEMWVYPEEGDTVIRLGISGQPVWQAFLPR